ncbi:hypothetical protein AGMMS49957_16880 [Synergistales bacterium]|nr:hypothetical protein AGMMS49957_16880 [Synergistales bacterium]
MEITLGLLAALYYVNGLMSAPYSSFINSLIATAETDLGVAFGMLLSHFRGSLLAAFTFNGSLLSYMRLTLFLITAVCIIIGVYNAQKMQIDFVSACCGLLLSTIFLIVAFLYDMFDWRDFRVFAPILLFVIVFAAMNYRTAKHLAVFAVACHLLYFNYLGGNLSTTVTHFGEPYAPVLTVEKIKFDPNTDNRWDNTVLIDFGYDTLGHEFDPGIGLILRMSDSADYTKEKYLLRRKPLLDEHYYVLEARDEVGYLYVRK